MSLMDERRALHEAPEEAPAPNPIDGPPRPWCLPAVKSSTLGIAAGALALLLLAVWRGAPAPLAPVVPPVAPVVEVTALPPPVVAAPPSARIAAWWAPGGEALPDGLALDAISGPVALCPTYPALVQVATGDAPGPWVEADAAGIGPELLAVLPPAGGVCAPPTATPAPVPVDVAPAPAPVVVEAAAPPTAILTATPCPLVMIRCGNLVEVRP